MFKDPKTFDYAVILNTHRFDGVMVKTKDKEYRVKIDPSAEQSNFTGIWEVTLGDKGALIPLRPRPGKSGAANVMLRLYSEIRLAHLIPWLKKASFVPVKTTFMARQGSKVVFRNKGHVVGINDGKKPWDLIGGQLEYGETPVEALLREIREETGLLLSSSQVSYIGQTKDFVSHVDFSEVWTTYLFEADLPPLLLQCRGVEERTMSGLLAERNVQPWVPRLIKFYQFSRHPIARFILSFKAGEVRVATPVQEKFLNAFESGEDVVLPSPALGSRSEMQLYAGELDPNTAIGLYDLRACSKDEKDIFLLETLILLMTSPSYFMTQREIENAVRSLETYSSDNRKLVRMALDSLAKKGLVRLTAVAKRDRMPETAYIQCELHLGYSWLADPLNKEGW